MRYLIKQKIFSLGDGFTIKDENGNDCFKVKGKIISIGNKLRIFDMDDKEVCYIEQKLFKLLPEYELIINSQVIAVVKQKLAFLARKFNIYGSAGEYQVEGNLLARDFRILKNGSCTARISKKLLALSDTYTVDVEVSENHGLILALVIVLDMICHNQK